MVTWYQILFGTRASHRARHPLPHPGRVAPSHTLYSPIFFYRPVYPPPYRSWVPPSVQLPISFFPHGRTTFLHPGSSRRRGPAGARLPLPARQRPGEEKVRSSSMHRRFPLARRKELLEQVPSRRRSLAYLPHDGIRSRDKSAEPGEDPALHELRVEGHRYPSDVKCV